MPKSNDAYFRGLPDYDEISPYLESANDEVELPAFVPDFSNILVADYLPKVTQEKTDKLKDIILKILRKVSPDLAVDSIEMPLTGSPEKTLGFCFITFPSAADAENAIKQIHNKIELSPGKPIILLAYADLERFQNLQEQYVESALPPFNPQPDPCTWLTDPFCRDQFVVRHDNETEIFFANTTVGDKPSLVYGGEAQKMGGKQWCEGFVQWSPQGTYLATFHPQGIKLWGGALFEDQGKFLQEGVQELQFSPCEKYMVTYVWEQSTAQTMVVWDIGSRTKIKTFEYRNPLDAHFYVEFKIAKPSKGEGKDPEYMNVRGRVEAFLADTYSFTIKGDDNKTYENIHPNDVTPLQDPNRLKWSCDGKFVARLDVHTSGTDIITIFEFGSQEGSASSALDIPTLKIHDKRSFAAPGAVDFSWSPKKNMFAYWSHATGNLPARVNIVGFPERNDICSRNLFQVQDGVMAWQDQGDYLCVYMTKVVGKKRSVVLLLFRVKEPSCPVEQLEITEHPVKDIVWEPGGDRLAIVTGEQRFVNGLLEWKSPFNILFYSMNGIAKDISATGISAAMERTIPGLATAPAKKAPVKEKKELTLLFTLTGQSASDVIWSPAGGIVALASYSEATNFDLHDVDNNVNLATRRHERGNKLIWDPSGRIIVSCTISPIPKEGRPRGNPSDGMIMYTFQGNVLSQIRQEKLYQFSWRPRPKDLLSAEEKKKIIKNLKNYEKDFEKEDRQKRQDLHHETVARRRSLAEEFLKILRTNQNYNIAGKIQRVRDRGGYNSDDDKNYVYSTVQEEKILKSTTQIVSKAEGQ